MAFPNENMLKGLSNGESDAPKIDRDTHSDYYHSFYFYL